ncbi:MAG: TlpA disulfide reductase family protein [Rhodoferax sp.]|uniref:TlpA family protein disulfide reductase n=1 Tax=Rhodoferax sp. TaxID=50421 RepID=UPI00261FF09E|nr:TlpA disulfide reductase family protein [Rhodoferax sp.]MDD2880675.1 TlpA disulfide reductase family protein [Rhodoferax sp.]
MNPTRRRFTTSLPVLGAMMLGARHGGLLAQTTPAAMEAVAPPLPVVGTTLTLPEVALFDGTVFKPEQAKGRITLIYWWASTCPFCALQSPEMQKLWQAQQAHGLRMLALSVDKKPADAVAYLQKKGYTFPAAWVTPDIHKVLPKPRGLPVTLVLGRDGRVLQAERGQMFPEDVAQLASWL